MQTSIEAERPPLSRRVEVIREGMFGEIRTCGTCIRHTDHGFEAEVPTTLTVGEEVQAELLSTETAEPIRAAARVIYRNRNHYGFFFRSGSLTRTARRENSVSRMIQ